MRISDWSSDVCSSDLNGEGKKAIAPIRAYFDHVLANRPTIGLEFIPVAPGKGTSTCTDRWCWCDALFMAPPTMPRLAQATGDRRSPAFVPAEWKATTAYPFDPAAQPYFPDSPFSIGHASCRK